MNVLMALNGRIRCNHTAPPCRRIVALGPKVAALVPKVAVPVPKVAVPVPPETVSHIPISVDSPPVGRIPPLGHGEGFVLLFV